jgi:hypothetical protein
MHRGRLVQRRGSDPSQPTMPGHPQDPPLGYAHRMLRLHGQYSNKVPRVEAGQNTSTVDPATEREPSAQGYNWATLFLGDINTGTWPSRLGESQTRQ